MNYFYSKESYECGVDECARGCLFGRIYGAVVVYPKESNNHELEKLITDSKKLSKKKRELLYPYIKERAIDFAVSWLDEKEIDSKGIQFCNMKIFHDCIDKLKKKPDLILVDGTQFKKYHDINHICIKKGDTKYISIASASILAKVEHDNYIKELCKKNIDLVKYDLINNMGYGTKKHIEAIKQYGLSNFHRKSYKLKIS